MCVYIYIYIRTFIDPRRTTYAWGQWMIGIYILAFTDNCLSSKICIHCS